MPSRLYEIDLFRFVAALSVVLMHYTFLSSVQGSTLLPPLYPALGEVFRYGYLGVELFFLISGFVILMTAEAKTPAGFLRSRFLRLYPAYWICCTLTFFVLFFGPAQPRVTLSQYLANLTMIAPVFGSPLLDGVYWSLLVEIRFYFLIFLLMIFRQVHRMDIFLWLWFGISLLLTFTPGRLPRLLESALITKYSAYFIAGALSYLLLRHGRSPSRLLLFVLCYPLALYHAYQHLLLQLSRLRLPFSFPLIAGILGLFFFLFLALGLRRTEGLRHPRWLALGLLTYPLYLIHNAIGVWLLQTYSSLVPWWLGLGGLTSAALFLSYAIHRWAESPLASALDRLLSSVAARLMSFRLPFLHTPPPEPPDPKGAC